MAKSNNRGGRRRGAGRKPLSLETHERNGTRSRARVKPVPVSDGGLATVLADADATVAKRQPVTDFDIIPPEHLSESSAAFHRHISPWIIEERGEFGCGPSLELLQRACELMDVAEKARVTLEEHGLTYTTATGVIRPRPEFEIQKSAISEMRNCLHDLGIV